MVLGADFADRISGIFKSCDFDRRLGRRYYTLPDVYSTRKRRKNNAALHSRRPLDDRCDIDWLRTSAGIDRIDQFVHANPERFTFISGDAGARGWNENNSFRLAV